MEITIIGWYGTETIGDRAILAGLFHVFQKVYGNFSIRLGSLYPFYTNRTLIEDIDFYKYCSSNKNLNILVFDSQNPFELSKHISESQLLVVGGGPLMDLREMHMLDFAFSYARRHKIRTALLGCGWGPLKDRETIEIACRLINTSSLTIFRDETSVDQFRKHSSSEKEVYGLIDPAFFASLVFLHKHKEYKRREDYIACNFRDVALEGDHYSSKIISSDFYVLIVKNIQKKYGLPVKLVPMHNFFIGGDDRIILSNIEHALSSDSIHTIREPQSLEQTMLLYYNAKACVGMRFHSIVLQTVLNGKNIVVDYTDAQNGKIISMIRQLGIENCFERRYFPLYSNNKLEFDFQDIKRIDVDKNQILNYEDRFVDLLKNIE